MISKHILGTFDEALGTLRNNVLMMASLTERSLENALRGLLERDDDLCATSIADDEEIDQLEKQKVAELEARKKAVVPTSRVSTRSTTSMPASCTRLTAA